MSDPSSIFIPAKPRISRKRKPVATSQTPGAPLVLVAAGYEPGGLAVELTFDRAIDVTGIVPGAFVVRDGEFQFVYEGVSVNEQPTPQSVRLNLNGIADFFGEGVHMDAAEGSGIVAADDGGTWAGVTDLELPFP